LPQHQDERRAAGRAGLRPRDRLVNIASILATGHEAGVTAPGETREEAEKRLSTPLMRGDQIIALDNCEGPLEGVVFNQALTQQYVNLRILGQSKGIRVRCTALIVATGNNLIIKGDLIRRSVVCRLDPKVERPELRQFNYNPTADAKTNRGELVAAALTILRAYHVAGRPDRPPRLQSFEQWSDTVRAALMWLDAGDPVGTMDRLRKADPELGSLTAVLHAWRAAFGVKPTTAREAITAADDRSDLHEALMAIAGRSGRIDSRVLGNWLAHRADRVVNISDNLLSNFVAMEAAGQKQGVALWRVAIRT
jgi:putative DNA primase/helicase